MLSQERWQVDHCSAYDSDIDFEDTVYAAQFWSIAFYSYRFHIPQHSNELADTKDIVTVCGSSIHAKPTNTDKTRPAVMSKKTAAKGDQYLPEANRKYTYQFPPAFRRALHSPNADYRNQQNGKIHGHANRALCYEDSRQIVTKLALKGLYEDAL